MKFTNGRAGKIPNSPPVRQVSQKISVQPWVPCWVWTSNPSKTPIRLACVGVQCLIHWAKRTAPGWSVRLLFCRIQLSANSSVDMQLDEENFFWFGQLAKTNSAQAPTQASTYLPLLSTFAGEFSEDYTLPWMLLFVLLSAGLHKVSIGRHLATRLAIFLTHLDHQCQVTTTWNNAIYIRTLEQKTDQVSKGPTMGGSITIYKTSRIPGSRSSTFHIWCINNLKTVSKISA